MWLAERPFRDSIFTPDSVDSNSPKRKKKKNIYIYVYRCIGLALMLKPNFHPWCNARLDPISCNKKFPDYCKPSKVVCLKSHPGHIVNCFIVNEFAFRHFTVSWQYFEFFPVESEENFFNSYYRIGSLRTLWTESAKRTTFEFFNFLEAL